MCSFRSEWIKYKQTSSLNRTADIYKEEGTRSFGVNFASLSQHAPKLDTRARRAEALRVYVYHVYIAPKGVSLSLSIYRHTPTRNHRVVSHFHGISCRRRRKRTSFDFVIPAFSLSLSFFITSRIIYNTHIHALTCLSIYTHLSLFLSLSLSLL